MTSATAGTTGGQRRGWTVARQVFALQLLIVAVLIVVATALAYVDARASQLAEARRADLLKRTLGTPCRRGHRSCAWLAVGHLRQPA